MTNQAPASQKTVDGFCTFSGLSLLPPPPLYRPFQLPVEKSSTDLKSKSSSKRVSSLAKTGKDFAFAEFNYRPIWIMLFF